MYYNDKYKNPHKQIWGQELTHLIPESDIREKQGKTWGQALTLFTGAVRFSGFKSQKKSSNPLDNYFFYVILAEYFMLYITTF